MANRRFIDFPIASTVGDSDIILIWQSGANKQTTKATFLSGLPENLEDLNDVAISGLTNGQILRYDSVTGKWENTDQGNLDLNDLNDVSIVSPSNGQVLVYNSSTSQWENSSGGFVPYVGAVTTVDLGAQGLRAGYVRFDTTVAGVPNEQGLMFWDADDETVDIILNGYTMKIGEDLFYPVKNQTGSTIAKGVAVRFNGTVGASGRLLIAPFIADGSVASSRFMGVTAEEILNGEDGKVLYFGRVRGINTNAFNEGDILYASTTVGGGYQTAIPVAPNNIVQVAAVVTKSATVGTIFVRPTLGSNINKDEGVKIVSVADKNLLQYQSGTGLWENKTLAQVIGGTSSQFLKGDGSLDSTSYGTGTVTSVGLSSATSGVTIGSTPVTTSGTITLAIATASGSQNGLLSSTDWTTFNSKQNALTNPVTGTGTTNYLPKFTGSTTIGNSNIQDSGSLVSVGVSTNFSSTVTAANNFLVNNPSASKKGYTYQSPASNWGPQVSGLYFTPNNAIDAATTFTVELWNGIGSIITPLSIASTGAATFSSSVGIGGATSTNGFLEVWKSGSSIAQLSIGQNSTYHTDFFIDASGNFYIQPQGTTRLTISASTGAATFSGNLGVNGSPANSFPLEAYINSSTAYTTSSRGNVFRVYNSNTAANIFAGIELGGAGTANDGLAGINGVVTGSGSGALTFYTRDSNTFSEKVRITSSGSVGIGTASPSSKLQIEGTGTSAWLTINRTDSGTNIIDFTQSGTRLGYIGYIGNDLFLNNATASNTAFFTNSAERMRITSSGNVLIGTTTDSGFKLFVNGAAIMGKSGNQALILRNGTTADRFIFYVGDGTSGTVADENYILNNNTDLNVLNNGGGVQLVNGATSWTSASDIKLKNINSIIVNAVEKIKTLKAINYSWKSDTKNKENLGLIAQEIKEVFPQIVDERKDGYLGVRYTELIPVLVSAIQELKQEIDTLKN